MRLLILGGEGMLGHCFASYFFHNEYDVYVSIRSRNYLLDQLGIISRDRILANIDVTTYNMEMLLDRITPDVVINAIGVLQHFGGGRPEQREIVAMIDVNAAFPHTLADLCIKRGIRLIHISTDCVFSGQVGQYDEDSFADSNTIYGRTKYLGEIALNNCLTLRACIVGRELVRQTNLLEWFLHQSGKICGYRNAIFTGMTTHELTRVLALVINSEVKSGLYHVAGPRTSKYDFLLLCKDIFGKDIEIIPDDVVKIDCSLLGARFESTFDYKLPSWDEMLMELAECTKY